MILVKHCEKMYLHSFSTGGWGRVRLRIHRRPDPKPSSLIYFSKSEVSGHNVLGPVVQSIVSSTSSLRGQLVKCFMTL